jgi:hypothetical protein
VDVAAVAAADATVREKGRHQPQRLPHLLDLLQALRHLFIQALNKSCGYFLLRAH